MRDDEAVSPVIAVILMVAITVVLAATVYVWVSGFASEDTGPEQASATAKGVDLDDDGDVEWARITLTKGNNAPYQEGDVTISATDPSGAAVGTLCENATSSSCSGGSPAGEDEWADSVSGTGVDKWDVGESIWAPCANAASGGNMIISASVKGTTILDTQIKCEENA